MASYLDPELLSRLEGLTLLPRLPLHGTASGAQIVSVKRGSSLEFVDYKNYAFGDDPRWIDWKVYGRKDRYFLRSYEGETNCTVWILLDASRSMLYQSPASPQSKWAFACRAALGLSYLALKRRDGCGLGLFADKPLGMMAPKATWDILAQAAHFLDGFLEFGGMTDYSSSFQALAAPMRTRSLVIVASDFLGAAPEAIFTGLQALSSRGHEVWALRILDPAECDLKDLKMPAGILRFQAMEQEAVNFLECDWEEVSQDYKERLLLEEKILLELCHQKGIAFFHLTTNEDAAAALRHMLTWRQSNLG